MLDRALWCFASMDGHWPDASSMRGGEHLHARLMFAGFRPWDPSGTSDSAVRQQRSDAWKKMSQSSEVQADPTPPSRPLQHSSACKTHFDTRPGQLESESDTDDQADNEIKDWAIDAICVHLVSPSKNDLDSVLVMLPVVAKHVAGYTWKHCILPWPQSLREHTLCFARRQPTADWLPWDLSRHE